jgi:hypothetical protein
MMGTNAMTQTCSSVVIEEPEDEPWDVFLSDDDLEPEPEPGDFWFEDEEILFTSAAADVLNAAR